MLSIARSTCFSRASTVATCTGSTQWRQVTRRAYAVITSPEELGDRHKAVEARQYAQPAGPNGTTPKTQKKSDGVVGLVVTDKPHSTSLDALLGAIERQDGEGYAANGDNPRLSVLLTPTFAQHATNQQLPGNILQRLGSDALPFQLEVITAVVDRLPDGSADGQEGLSYLLQRNASPLSIVSQMPFSASSQKAGSIHFEIPHETPRTAETLETVQMPLAQTIFSTGMISTMVHAKYSLDTNTSNLRMQKSQYLESQTLRLPLHSPNRNTGLQMPLVPLTPLRLVRNCMGNIVRTLSSATSLEESRSWPGTSPTQPASQELEAVVSTYFKALALPPEAVNVWALIVPKDPFPWQGHDAKAEAKYLKPLLRVERASGDMAAKYWKALPEEDHLGFYFNATILRTIMHGGRLCKVLSGGGGWGKKAGLLSLDPDAEYSSRDLRQDRGWEFDFSDESEEGTKKQQQQALGEVIAEGEHVMFFLAPKEDYPIEQASKVSARFAKADRRVIFGPIPSTIDNLTAEESSEAASNSTPTIRHLPGVFGVLSEGGMAVTTSRDNKTSKSKIDVPYGILRVLELGPAQEWSDNADREPNAHTRVGRLSQDGASNEDGPSRESRLAYHKNGAFNSVRRKRTANRPSLSAENEGTQVSAESYFQEASQNADDATVEREQSTRYKQQAADPVEQVFRKEYSRRPHTPIVSGKTKVAMAQKYAYKKRVEAGHGIRRPLSHPAEATLQGGLASQSRGYATGSEHSATSQTSRTTSGKVPEFVLRREYVKKIVKQMRRAERRGADHTPLPEKFVADAHLEAQRKWQAEILGVHWHEKGSLKDQAWLWRRITMACLFKLWETLETHATSAADAGLVQGELPEKPSDMAPEQVAGTDTTQQGVGALPAPSLPQSQKSRRQAHSIPLLDGVEVRKYVPLDERGMKLKYFPIRSSTPEPHQGRDVPSSARLRAAARDDDILKLWETMVQQAAAPAAAGSQPRRPTGATPKLSVEEERSLAETVRAIGASGRKP